MKLWIMPLICGLICSWHVHHKKTPFVWFSFWPTPLYSGPALLLYVWIGRSVWKCRKDRPGFHLHLTYRFRACVGPLRPVVIQTCRWSNTVSNEALLTVLSSREGARLRRVEWDASKGIYMYIPYPVSGVDLWQGSNPGGSQWVTMCCVRRQVSNARVYGSGRLWSIPLAFFHI